MNPSNDEILESLRPQMRRARVAHVRRLIAGVAVVPILGLGAVAMAADDGADAPSTETASAGADDDGPAAPDVAMPEIGEAESGEAPKPIDPEPVDADENADGADKNADEADDEQRVMVLSLGELGVAEVAETDGGFELLGTDMVAGWEIERIEKGDAEIRIVVVKGDRIKLITILPGVRDELDVRIADVVIPTTTTTTTTVKPEEPEPEPKPEPEPLPPVVDRIVVEMPEGRGTFVVEREGETLWLGNVQPNDGYEYEIGQAEGHKVWVLFTDGQWNWYGKAKINEAGQIETHFWDEERIPEPVHQWVEISEVGAVKFKLYDGLIHVKEWVTAECCGFYDYNNGAPSATAKVDFEGAGILWIVEAWVTESGELAWSSTDMSPEPPADPPAEPPADGGEGEGTPGEGGDAPT